MFHTIETKDLDGNFAYTVERIDRKSFHDGVVGYNFEYTEEGALCAIRCMNNLEKECQEGFIK
jgi:hypothetical protein